MDHIEKMFVGICAIALSIPTTFLGAYVMTRYLGWFVLPVFPSMPALSVIQAFGIMLMVAFFSISIKVNQHLSDIKLSEISPDDSDKYSEIVRQVFMAITYLWALLFGAAVHTIFF
jgi:hypothetical protein